MRKTSDCVRGAARASTRLGRRVAERRAVRHADHMPRTVSAEAVDIIAFDGEPVVLERDGKAFAAVVSLADLALIRRIEDEEDNAAADAAEADPTPHVSLEEAFAFLDAE